MKILQVPKMISGRIACDRSELNLEITLHGGQSFRWSTLDNDGNFRGVFAGHVWTLSQSDDYINYSVHTTNDKSQNYDSLLKKYFRLNICLQKHIEKWNLSDPHFSKSCDKTVGVRILDQDVEENLFSFICSSNNNIIRISGMVEKLCQYYGEKIGEIEGKVYYNFPTIEALSKNTGVESQLRKEGFGYRASYIAKSAEMLSQLGGRKWLLDLHESKGTSYASAKMSLMTLTGIGPKVADCICLMSLGHLAAIPVDTHIFQVACLNYLPHLNKRKSVTPKILEEISDHLRTTWGELAGWAQAIVFCAKINNNIPKKRSKSVLEDKEKKKIKK